MSRTNLEKAFDSRGQSIRDFFGSHEQGFLVPDYQREYTWEEENVTQLFDDLVLGTAALERDDADAVTFLGTAIVTTKPDKAGTVRAGDERAQPTEVQVVIDGQQRISTIALLGIRLQNLLECLISKLPDEPPYSSLHSRWKVLDGQLTSLYALNLAGRGGMPPLKPRIIRHEEDYWTHEGDDSSYSSPVARYIATYIRETDSAAALRAIAGDGGVRVRGNVSLMDKSLHHVLRAGVPDSALYGQFPSGNSVVTPRMQRHVLGYHEEPLEKIIGQRRESDGAEVAVAAGVYSLFLLSHYLLNCCGLNRLEPRREAWGFDMFQALNGTGTPLTALETLKPQVRQTEERSSEQWKATPSREHMDEIDALFERASSNQQKNRRTNELLRAFALCWNGDKLGNRFSAQRRWLNAAYGQELETLSEKRDWLGRLARVANFYQGVWFMDDAAAGYPVIEGFEEHERGQFVSFLVRYLRDANSKLSAPILARFYSQVLQGLTDPDEFVEAAKACAAFFTLWRSANSTSGLDDVYRRFFRSSDQPVEIGEHIWSTSLEPVSVCVLKGYFRGWLEEKGIGDKDGWVEQTKRFLLYTEVKNICRFCLFLANHDREPDGRRPGLTERGKDGVRPLLELKTWLAKDYKTLEHVAPQNPPHGHRWETRIYAERSRVHEVGNLLLLPTDVNSLVDNSEWAVKFLHYSHVGSPTADRVEQLSEQARQRGVQLKSKAVNKLKATTYNPTVAPVLNVGLDGVWGSELIDERTDQIKTIVWNTLTSWLEAE